MSADDMYFIIKVSKLEMAYQGKKYDVLPIIIKDSTSALI